MKNTQKFNSKQRFSHTVENYVKYRPHYPKAAIDFLKKDYGLKANHIIADIGSGTGIFTKLLLDNGNKVCGVEPNGDMRQASETYLSEYKNFMSLNASAEHTTLEDHSVDMITAAQAFHWFHQKNVKKEFERILKPNGLIVLLWNLRVSDQSDVMQAYEQLLQTFGTDYKDVCAEGVTDASVQDFFSPHETTIVKFPNTQTLNWESFKGRLLSTSYTPKPGAENYDDMLHAAKTIFDKNQVDGFITFIYETKVYVNR